MDRRRFMQTAAASAGSVALGGCLGGDEDPLPETGTDLQQYDLPAYSGLVPAETQAGGGVVFLQLRLPTLGAIQAAAETGRLPDGPLVDLPLSGVGTAVEAVETLSSYPFAAALRQAINTAAGPLDGDAFGTNGTVVAPGNESAEASTTTNETRTNEPTATAVGIEVTALSLIDELLVFEGRFDRAVVAERYTEGFQQVDQQRGLRIYEGVGNRSGLAFAVGEEMLVVPTETGSRTPAAETVLAHSLSAYINTVGRVVDDQNGRWLFETTGPAAVSLGVWGADSPVDRIADSVRDSDDLPTGQGAVFGSVDGFISALQIPADDTETAATAEGRFAGVFSGSVPTEDELRANLLSGGTAVETVRDPPRAHVAAAFEEDVDAGR